ncbi:28S ribosomal protein S15, mitochondrial-like [Varroa jacobsoni]|uniref:28S ribosomal protein S15, mitochondrial-like n=1 Tax=Varroa jacobsoni TaxID=62625 RepID=UPI000BF9A08B|nr:28S ribosomal protein S15, mitochondrial-like [Varroa jacobsoni]XP_022703519.1 28S ribosomal protein S15, mitochondrial-like [Varroa jacobsoni]XP_022703520.1 28S ribosomal protein S15, mitochondrial-like [Varroa jacobsoni]XP_022703521.1 28S ribosomal protein S15, mitochondrial-like [Varroa jacobsoni]
MLRQTFYRAILMEKAKLGTRRANALFEVPVRYTRTFRYPKVTYLPFDWDYPPKKDYIDLSGDRTMDIGFTKDVLKRPKLPFSRLPEIDEAPEEMKKIFSVEFASYSDQRKSIKDEFLNRVRRHPYDTESFEYKIARDTFFIRSFKEVYKTSFKKSKVWKVKLLEAISRRNKQLKQLGRYDFERYEFVKQVLEIEHSYAPLERTAPKVTRKSELRRLTTEHAEKIKQDKLTAYHEKLKVLQKEFEVEKREAEEFIVREIAELKLTDEEVKSLEYERKIF